ncbi:hypothetical protein EJB05_06150, partial [Eragrostis curvula]
MAAAAPRPKSPPASPDPCGRHRLQLAVDALHREIGFLEGEISSIEGAHAASRCCKEVDDFVVRNPDPFITIGPEKRCNDQSLHSKKFRYSEELPELPVVDDLLLRRLLAVPSQEAAGAELLLRRAAEEAVLLLLVERRLLLPVRRGVRELLLRLLRAVPALLVRLHLLVPEVLLRLPQVQRRVLRPSLLSMLVMRKFFYLFIFWAFVIRAKYGTRFCF